MGPQAKSTDIDMRAFARGAGPNLTFAAGTVVFSKGDPGNCMYSCSRA
jgi:hypothetical protein